MSWQNFHSKLAFIEKFCCNVNPIKMAKCIVELERIYGIKKGNNQNSLLNNSTSKTQSDIAKQLDIDRTQYLNYKKLNDLIPELQALVETNHLKGTTAYKIWAKLSKEEQEEFFNQLGIETINKLTRTILCPLWTNKNN